MLLKYFYDKKLAQASYLVGCAATGEALVIDPSRDIAQYIRAAEAEGVTITHVTETHIHADYVSGSRELAHQTGARLYLSDMGDADWKYQFPEDNIILVRDGDKWMIGNIKIQVMHTPGHTPEHISFMITDTAHADEPIGIFTGDFLFVGDVGRPDLLEEAAGIANTKIPGARQQFASVQRIKDLPDYLQIWPAHGAGSACGKSLGAIPSTTLGYEKRFNPAFQFETETAFVDWLLAGQPEAPRYFAQMKHVNKVGPLLLDQTPPLARLNAGDLQDLLRNDAFIIDTRNPEDFAANFVAGTLNIPFNSGGFNTYVGWFVDYERPLYFISYDTETVDEIVNQLRAIGVDDVPGYFTDDVIRPNAEQLPYITASELSEFLATHDTVILDVRGASEHAEQHMAGSINIPLGYIPSQLADLPQDKAILTHCASGLRSSIAASLLRKHGFTNVTNLRDTVAAWSQALPAKA